MGRVRCVGVKTAGPISLVLRAKACSALLPEVRFGAIIAGTICCAQTDAAAVSKIVAVSVIVPVFIEKMTATPIVRGEKSNYC